MSTDPDWRRIRFASRTGKQCPRAYPPGPQATDLTPPLLNAVTTGTAVDARLRFGQRPGDVKLPRRCRHAAARTGASAALVRQLHLLRDGAAAGGSLSEPTPPLGPSSAVRRRVKSSPSGRLKRPIIVGTACAPSPPPIVRCYEGQATTVLR